jgi:hypothetical protein
MSYSRNIGNVLYQTWEVQTNNTNRKEQQPNNWEFGRELSARDIARTGGIAGTFVRQMHDPGHPILSDGSFEGFTAASDGGEWSLEGSSRGMAAFFSQSTRRPDRSLTASWQVDLQVPRMQKTRFET